MPSLHDRMKMTERKITEHAEHHKDAHECCESSQDELSNRIWNMEVFAVA